MGYTLEQFASEYHRILKADSGLEGRKKVCALLTSTLHGAQALRGWSALKGKTWTRCAALPTSEWMGSGITL